MWKLWCNQISSGNSDIRAWLIVLANNLDKMDGEHFLKDMLFVWWDHSP